MLVLPVCLIEPVWAQFVILLPEHPPVDPTHPFGCHRPRVPDGVVFEYVIAALVHGFGYEPVATRSCSDRTIRRRGAPDPLQAEKRWAVERTFGWASRFRRLVRDYERLPETVVGLHVVVFACLIVHRLINLAVQSP